MQYIIHSYLSDEYKKYAREVGVSPLLIVYRSAVSKYTELSVFLNAKISRIGIICPPERVIVNGIYDVSMCSSYGAHGPGPRSTGGKISLPISPKPRAPPNSFNPLAGSFNAS